MTSIEVFRALKIFYPEAYKKAEKSADDYLALTKKMRADAEKELKKKGNESVFPNSWMRELLFGGFSPTELGG